MFDIPKTIKQFVATQQRCEAWYYGLRRCGLAPEELQIGNHVRITPQAVQAWYERRALQQSEAATIEAERQRELARIAGNRATESPAHISNRRRGRRARTRSHPLNSFSKTVATDRRGNPTCVVSDNEDHQDRAHLLTTDAGNAGANNR